MAAGDSWVEAWEHAAFGPTGFYRRERPYDHFATAVQTGATHEPIACCLQLAMRSPEPLTIVDAGAGEGRLIARLAASLPTEQRDRIRFIALDMQPRPDSLDAGIEWWQGDVRETACTLEPGHGLLIAHELLDDIPCEIVEVDADGTPHRVLAPDASGLGALDPQSLDAADRDWLASWWPADRPFMRCEVGQTRDRAWHGLTGWLTSGYAVALDYGHCRAEREAGRWDGGTLTGYLRGRAVPAVPDGRVNLTAHVAMDAVAAAASGHPATLLTRQGPVPDFWMLVQAYGGLPLPS